MLRLISFVMIIALTLGCNEVHKTQKASGSGSEAATKNMVEITGRVTTIKNRKDGYTATIETPEKNIYEATISIPNMTDPANYRRVAVGETITVTGELWKLDNISQLTVRKM